MLTYCSECGKPITADTQFCSHCGTSTSSYFSASGGSPSDPTIIRMHPNPYEVLIPPPPPPHREKALSILIGSSVLALILVSLGIFALLSLRGKGSAATIPTTPTPLYVANWSHGFDGWTAKTPDWEAIDGMIYNTGTDSGAVSPTLIAPYQVKGTGNYAIEVRMQVLAGPFNGCFDITTLRASIAGEDWVGYKAVVCENTVSIETGSIGSLVGHLPQTLKSTSFDPKKDWHIYRFEAKGTALSLLIDNKLVLVVQDSTYLSGGLLGLHSYETELNISSFKVIPL